MDRPKISVIIPAYKAEKYIENTITNVIEAKNNIQNISGDMEIIVVLDGEDKAVETILQKLQNEVTDVASGEILSEIDCEIPGDSLGRAPELRWIVTEHGGVSAARNRGLKEAQGEYISFIDADDTVEAGFFDRLLGYIEANNCDWVSCNYRFVDGGGSRALTPIYTSDTLLVGSDISSRVKDAVFSGPGENILSSVVTGLYRADKIRDNGIEFREDISYGEDLIFNYQLVHHIDSFGYVSEALYNYNVNNDSATATTFAGNLLEQKTKLLAALEEVREHYEDPYTKAYISFGAIQIRHIFQFDLLLRGSRKDRDKGYKKFQEKIHSPELSALWNEIKKRYKAPQFTHRVFFSMLGKENFDRIDRFHPLAMQMMAKNARSI